MADVFDKDLPSGEGFLTVLRNCTKSNPPDVHLFRAMRLIDIKDAQGLLITEIRCLMPFKDPQVQEAADAAIRSLDRKKVEPTKRRQPKQGGVPGRRELTH